jgi:hypothetical protein
MYVERKLTQFIDKALSRRSFLAGATATAAAGALAGCSSPNEQIGTTPTPTPNPSAPTYADADYLNFALNLEYLEAEFYLRAVTGNGLGSADTGNSTSKTIGGAQVSGLTMLQSQYLYEIAQNELDHVRFLRAALGTAAVSAPAIDLTNSFNALAQSAALGSTFNPFSNYNNFLIGAFIFEDVGVTAYHGAAPLLTNKAAYLAPAAEIHAVEAYHAASVRSQIVAIDAAAGNSNLTNIAVAVQKVRAALSGSSNPAETYLSATTIVNADPKTSIGYARTTDQVLHIVYAQLGNGYGVSSGGFFPSGLNGNIKQTYS